VAEKTNQRRHGSFRTVHAIDELFTLSKLVGKGDFAEVWLGRSRGNGRSYAVKSICKTLIGQGDGSTGLNAVACEIENHSTVVARRGSAVPARPRGLVGHVQSNVVELHMVIEDDNHIHIVLEACSGGNLMEVVLERAFTGPDMHEVESRDMIKAAARAVSQCHQAYVVHRDVKVQYCCN
jgi:calcium-dependent protein kinase